MSVRILQGDALSMLRTLDAKSVQCVVTSPPYFQLRDYQTGRWEGGAADCDHRQATKHQQQGSTSARAGRSNADAQRNENFRDICGKCGARRVDQQIGLEQTPAAFLDALYAVFDEVRRVLRDDGVVFCNLADSYSGSGKGPSKSCNAPTGGANPHSMGLNSGATYGIRPKSLILIPERFAIGMADRGWIVRSQIVWAKKSAMPESVRDRPTSAWEPIWMFTKQARYFWDADAVRQPNTAGTTARVASGPVHAIGANGTKAAIARGDAGGPYTEAAGANLRNVWHLGPEPSRDEHYAAYPTEIPRRCILAASRKGDTVLDPFLGSGTTALVADRLERNAIGIELSEKYVQLAERRLRSDSPMFADVEVAS